MRKIMLMAAAAVLVTVAGCDEMKAGFDKGMAEGKAKAEAEKAAREEKAGTPEVAAAPAAEKAAEPAPAPAAN